MKLATYRDGSRDGQLVVVSRDLTTAHYANGIAGRLQQVLDDWNYLSPQLEDLYVTLNQGRARHAFAFEPRQCMAPLPRAYQCACAAAYPGPRELLEQAAAGAIEQRPGDELLGPCDAVLPPPAGFELDFEAGIAVISGDIARGATAEAALEGVRLLLLANGWRLHPLDGDRTLDGAPPPAFGPVAVTPDELGEGWSGGRIAATLQVACNERRVALLDAGAMREPFGLLLARLAQAKRVRAGSIVVAAPVANEDAAKGHGCIADKRAPETLDDGAPRTAFLQPGDRVRIELGGRDGQSVFGAIEQTVRETDD